MQFELGQLFLVGIAYLSVLFGVAWCADRGIISERLIRHPIVFILSLGVVASAWSFYGMVAIAEQQGFAFLAYYFGISALFLFAPAIIAPLLRLSQRYQLGSLADLMAFRYRSQWAGILVTVFMVVAMLPLLALQMSAVSESVDILTQSLDFFTGENPRNGLAFGFCLVIILFTVLFGSRHLSAAERHNGLISAIAFESLTKLLVGLLLGFICVFVIFEGPSEMRAWSESNTAALQSFAGEADHEARYLLLLFFSAVVAVPHLFHMVFSERPNEAALRAACWGFPLYMLLLALPVLPILWAGIFTGSNLPPGFFALDIGRTLQSPELVLLTFLGGLSAASGTIIVCTIALASMCVNHLVLSVYQPPADKDIYHWLRLTRASLITAIILLAYVFYRTAADQAELASLGIAAFSALLQFAPGTLAILFWPGANRRGLIAGLLAGMLTWFVLTLLPLLWPGEVPGVKLFLQTLTGLESASWPIATVLALAFNSGLFIALSLLSKSSIEEQINASICSPDDLRRPVRRGLTVSTPREMQTQLGKALGKRTAQREFDNALQQLGVTHEETRPYALRRLRDQIQANLSGLLGPSLAHEVVNRHLPYVNNESSSLEDIYFIESTLENADTPLSGLAAELDSLRRYHRATLQKLPMGVCIIGADKEITLWNDAMVELTDIPADAVLGALLSSLEQPWQTVIAQFAEAKENHRHKQHVEVQGKVRWISLHKQQHRFAIADQVIMLEDVTETQQLEHELAHSERLAALGQLAAGVAHEIGNPVTGIACLAQNLRFDDDADSVQNAATEILQQTDRITQIMQSLVGFARAGNYASQQNTAPFAIASCLEEAVYLLNLNHEATPVEFMLDFGDIDVDKLLLEGDEQRLVQVFINLLSNARDASDVGAKVNISVSLDDELVVIDVADTGCGIPPKLHDQVFDPFFTTKPPGEGTGLGLALVHRIVEDHAGQLNIHSPTDRSTGTGTTISVRLPLRQES